MALHPTTEWPFSERSFSCMMQICTALHFMTSCWRRRGFNSFCYYMFNCVAGMVHSSEVKLGSAGVATFVLEQVPFFSEDVLFVRISGCCPSETELWLCIHVSLTRSTWWHPTPAYKTMVGSSIATGIYPTGRAVPCHTGYSGYTHSHCRDGPFMDDWPWLQSIEVSCNTGYQYSNCGDRTPHNTSGFLAGYLRSGCQTYIQ